MSQAFDFSYYKPINGKQEQFHQSKSRHKLLIGGVGSGKTYPAIHEALFICADNPGCEFGVFRNTWDSLKDNIQQEMLRVSERANCHRKWEKTDKNLHLHNGAVIRFRPLTMKTEQMKGMNLCGFLVDDPDVNRYRGQLAYLFSRINRNPPDVKAQYFASVTCANWEGKNWLWQVFMRGRDEGGDDDFAYWVLKTTDNPTLPPNYIKDLEAVHSQGWMERYVYCNINTAYTGLVFDEYESKIHDADLNDYVIKTPGITRILAVDVGFNVSCVLSMATDGKAIYVYDEWYKHKARVEELGRYIQDKMKTGLFKAVLIDPSSAKSEQTSQHSVKTDLERGFGIHLTDGDNNRNYGWELIKGLMTVRDGKTKWFIDPRRCPNYKREIEIFHWKEPSMSEFDEFAFKEKTVDVDDHACDCSRYGAVYLKKFLTNFLGDNQALAVRRNQLWAERRAKLKLYQGRRGNEEERHVQLLRRAHALGLGKKWADERRKELSNAT